MDKSVNEHFVNASPAGRVRDIEFVRVNGATHAFIDLTWPQDVEAFRTWLAAHVPDCSIVSQNQ